MTATSNFQVLRASRKPLRAGDIFALHLVDGRYLFGRVVLADIPEDLAPTPNCNLLYIYQDSSDAKTLDLTLLTPDHLLIPPIFTNRLAWSRGYFETVAHQPVVPDDLLPQHCFYDVLTRGYLDETGAPLPVPSKPCGIWGLASYQAISKEISEALGLPPPE